MPDLYHHQLAQAETMRREERWGIWHDCGTGKTAGALEFLRTARDSFPALVLAPVCIVRPAWGRDHETFAPELDLHLFPGAATLDGFTGKEDVVVTNYEAFISARGQALRKQPWKTVVLDESTRIMSPVAKTTRLLHGVTRKGPRHVFPMSGCPTPNSLLDFWGQVEAFAPGHLGSTFYAFRAKHFWKPRADLSWLWKPNAGAYDEIMDLVLERSSILRKEDCLDLPETMVEVREVELTKDERRAYRQMERDWLVELESGNLVGGTALSELMRLRQITAGVARTDTGAWVEVGRSKLEALCELIGDVGKTVEGKNEQVLVAGEFRTELERIASTLRQRFPNRSCAILYGGMRDHDRMSAIDGFVSGEVDTLVVHPQTAGHGLTFTGCAHVVFTSLSYSYEDHYQVMNRVHRIGQTRKVVYHYLLANDTIDQDLYDCLERKEGVTEALVDRYRRSLVASP